MATTDDELVVYHSANGTIIWTWMRRLRMVVSMATVNMEVHDDFSTALIAMSVKVESTMMVKATEMAVMVKAMMVEVIVEIAEATVIVMVMVKMTARAQEVYQLE